MQYANGRFFASPYTQMYSPLMTIGDRLDKAMKDAKIASQSELQRLSGVPQATISRILKGDGKRGPETETIKKLARACRVSFEWLNEGTGSDAQIHDQQNTALDNTDRNAAMERFQRIASLYWQSTEGGQLSILRMAERATKARPNEDISDEPQEVRGKRV